MRTRMEPMLALGVLAAPLGTVAQMRDRVYRVGYLSAAPRPT